MQVHVWETASGKELLMIKALPQQTYATRPRDTLDSKTLVVACSEGRSWWLYIPTAGGPGDHRGSYAYPLLRTARPWRRLPWHAGTGSFGY